MRTIIIDPLLKDQSGHQFSYVNRILSELKKRDIAFFIFGSYSAHKNELQLENFAPCLNDVVSAIFNTKFLIPIPSPFVLFKSVIRLEKQLDKCLLKDEVFQLQENDILFFHTLYIFEFLSVGLFFYKRSKFFLKQKIKVIIPFNFPYKRNSFFITLFLAFMYKFICNFLLSVIREKVTYLTSPEAMRQDYERLLKTGVVLCPIAIYPISYAANKSAIATQLGFSERRIKISYLGQARYNKGFDILVKTIKLMVLNKESVENILFLVQLDVQKQLRQDLLVVQESAKELESLAREFPNLKIIHGALNMDDYYNMLFSADIVFLPYRKEIYDNTIAGVFVEAMIADKVPIVSDNTTMAKELRKYGLSDLVFNIDEEASIIRVIKQAVSNYEKYKVALKPLQDEYKRVHSISNLVDIITSD